jgi:hypothetical protein
MAAPDKVFEQTYAWYQASITRVLASSALSPAQRAQVEPLIWQALGLLNPAAPPANPDLADFRDNGGAADSLAIAATVVAEALVALSYVQQAVAALAPGGNPAAALAVIGPVLQQVDRLSHLQAGSRYPSAFSIGKILLMLSGDGEADPPANHEADKLAALLGAVSAADVADAQAALGIVSLLIGSMIDRSFIAPSADAAAGWVTQALPDFTGRPKLTLSAPGGFGGSLEIDPGPPSAIKAALNLALNQSKPIDGTSVTLGLSATAGVGVLVPILPLGPVQVSGDYALGIDLKRSKADGALVIGSDGLGVKLAIGELGVSLMLKNGAPALQFFAHNARATIKPSDGFLKLILGDGITVGLDVTAEADAAGTLRLVNGTGLHANLPVPTLPTGPFQLQLINLGLDPVGGSFAHLQVEVSASFGVELGPFAASVDRLGILLDLDVNNAGRPISFAFKPPDGIGLSLDAGVIKGGGYLSVDANGYAGVLELKFLAVDVKAIAILNTHSEAGFSLLLLIFGQFPAIQLSFGFTLTGVGGLIGVQHTASPPALSQALSAGQLDAVLFPDNPVANAPQIITTLRTLFPVRAGGFIIGPMLELGWGTPSLVTVRLGLLIEAGQFTLLGQAIIQIPPLVSSDLALLYLRLDFVGSVVFDPLRIAFDAKLIHSRIALISITGQFAFRAEFGDHPTFLISAGGFHPRFKEIPSDVPAPFDRVGASLDIGIVGIELKGYFAITSATVQAGASLRAWADIGIASIEGGFGFDAICYLVPKFYFELDIFAYLDVHVFGVDFASIHLDGTLAGPGRWHIAGNAKVHTPWPLPDFSVHIDEHWGTDRDTPQITVNVATQLGKEISKIANWSAQLPKGGDGFLSLADIKAGTDVLAHPLGTLVFQQKLVPFELRMAKASGSRIDGANEFSGGTLQLTQNGQSVPSALAAQARSDFFAAAQFLELSQDDKLAKPSFESFTAGYELGDDHYDIGEVVEETLNYEEADLGGVPVPKRLRRIGLGAYAQATHGALLRFGSAGRSTYRNRTLTQPAQSTALRVDPAPVTVATKDSLTVAAGAQVYSSAWRAHQARAASNSVEVANLAVVEVAEIA